MSDFSNYELGDNVYELAGGVLPEMAEAAGFDLGPEPTEEALSGLVGRLGPQRELQRNIELVKEFLGPYAQDRAADWVERSGVLIPLQRPFAAPGEMPREHDAIVFSGGVARWMLRRMTMVETIDPETVGRVVLPIGNRPMGSVEHQLVKTFEARERRLPTEAEFAERYLLGRLAAAGFREVDLVKFDTKNGDDILAGLFAMRPELLDGSILVPANAPSAIQTAGQLRVAARNARSDFDSNGDQMAMVSDAIEVARNPKQKPATHQDPFSALGQIARNALFLQRNQ